MTDLLHFVSLSLRSPWCWRVAADWLRRGDRPDHVLRRLLTARPLIAAPGQDVDIRALATADIPRAETASIAAIPWHDPAYPVALTTIADPPPVLWTRGRA